MALIGQVYARGRNRGVSVVFVRDVTLHSKQRRVWDKGFNGNALKDYEQLLIKRAQELLEILELRPRSGEAVDVSRYTVPNAQKIILSHVTSIAHRTDTQIFPGGFPALPRTKPGVGRIYIQFLDYLKVVLRG